MKKNLWIIFAAAISTSLMAQDASNSVPTLQAPPPPASVPAATPPPAPATTTPELAPMPAVEAPTNAPAPKAKAKTTKKKTVAKKPAAKKAPELKTVPLVAGPATVSANHVNVRSKAGLVGEVISHMTNGEPVTVVEEVHLKNSGPEEPSAWAKILLPSDTHVWIKTSYIDTNNTVSAKKLNLRAGPGENYGVVGTVEKGAAVQSISTKGDWTEIQAPANAYAFMAAQYLKQGEETPTVAMNNATPPPETAPTTNTMAEMPGMAPAPTEVPGAMDTNNVTPAPAPAPVETPAPAPVVQEPPPPRIISHEGIVRASFSIQAPTRFELVSVDSHKTINYLFPPTTNLDLSRYKGMHIIVTGEEGLDERWKNTPVITIQKIQVLD
jgi:uncharacterized protein YgiM (DUF1202 family)